MTPNTLCFTASYVLALVLQLLRLRGHRWVSTMLVTAVTALGWVAHSWFLLNRALSAEGSPLSSPAEWYSMAAWGLAMACLYWELSQRRTVIGLFTLPLVLGLIGIAFFADDTPFTADKAWRIWGIVHGVFFLLGTVTVMAGFAAGIMYLVHSYRLKRKLTPVEGFRLPSLEWLQHANARCLHASLPLIAIGFLAGIVLNLIARGPANADPSVSWTGPVFLSSAGMFLWLLVAEVFNWIYPAAHRGRKVAYLTVASFLFLALALAALLLSTSEHSGRGKSISNWSGPATVQQISQRLPSSRSSPRLIEAKGET